MSIPLQFVSLYDGQEVFVWSDCLMDLGTDGALNVETHNHHHSRHHHHHHHLSLNREGRWGIADDFATRFLHFSSFFTALWDLPNSRPVHSLMLSSYLFLCLPCLPPPFTVPCKMVLARPDERET